MILTGERIETEVDAGRITIDPFDPARLEPNSYGFRLGPRLLSYEGLALDARTPPPARATTLPPAGLTLLPGRLYLAHTLEVLGSPHYAATLYASRSTATLGMWITFSAPLGHSGAILAWTLEVRAAHPIVVYPEMPIGKIAFWAPQGDIDRYDGKYAGSRTAVASRLAAEYPTPRRADR